jgi:alpha-L-fucosidase
MASYQTNNSYKVKFNKVFLISMTTLVMLNFFSLAQDLGDEDKDMKNLVSENRDKSAIKEAKEGWWNQSMLGKEERLKWWREARFGMFIHWGVYSLPGGEWKGKEVGGYAEHLMRKEQITRKEYLELASKFNPVNFNADQWVKSARDAGMHYFIVTAKHHDGFAMYPSAVSDFSITEKTPFKRDPMAELAAACKKYGLKFGFYYSHAFDWEHPDAPGNDWEFNNPGGDKLLFGGRDWFIPHPELIPKAQKYVDQKAIPQIRELLKNYNPDIIWFDTPHKLPLSENLRILKAIREVAPNVVVNGRLARTQGENFGDYLNTADRPAEFFPVTGDWEAIPTTNESYGYSKYDNTHKPASHFIGLLSNAVSRGGNLLMNIGPKGDGSIDVKDQRILDSLAIWMKKNEPSVHKASSSPLPIQSWGVVTKKDNLLYLHVNRKVKDNSIIVGGFNSDFNKVYLLGDESKKALKTKRLKDGELVVALPKSLKKYMNLVLVIDAIEPIEASDIRYIDNNITNRLLAFDAMLSGKGLRYGDGKTNKYFVDNWKNKEQYLSWKLKSISSGKFKLQLKYIDEKDNSGIFVITIGENEFIGEIKPSGQNNSLIVKEIGVVDIGAGVHEINQKTLLD